jgi:hypothetical protein
VANSMEEPDHVKLWKQLCLLNAASQTLRQMPLQKPKPLWFTIAAKAARHGLARQPLTVTRWRAFFRNFPSICPLPMAP